MAALNEHHFPNHRIHQKIQKWLFFACLFILHSLLDFMKRTNGCVQCPTFDFQANVDWMRELRLRCNSLNQVVLCFWMWPFFLIQNKIMVLWTVEYIPISSLSTYTRVSSDIRQIWNCQISTRFFLFARNIEFRIEEKAELNIKFTDTSRINYECLMHFEHSQQSN